MGVEQIPCRGECRGGTPSAVIRSSGMYGARTKRRSRLYLADLPPGRDVVPTGKSVGGGGVRRAQWAMKADEAAMRHRARSATMPN